MSTTWSHKRGLGLAFVVICAGWALPATATAESTDIGATVESEVEALDALAIDNNQSIQAFDSRARQSQRQAEFREQQWPDPMIEYMADLSAPWTPHFTTGHMVRLMQTIPRGGARQAQAAPARAEEQVVRSGQAEATVDLLRDIRLDVVALARIAARIELLEDEIGLIEDALGVVEAVAPFGDADHGDFYQLELARETASDNLAALRSQRESRRARLAARMGVETERVEQMEFPADVLEAWLIELPDDDDLIEMARRQEPGLATLDAQAAVADARIDLVDERQRPWPQVMVGYSNMPPMFEMDGPRSQMIQVGVSVPLPIFGGQYDVEASQWQEARQAVEQDRTQMSAEIRGQVEDLLAGWETDRERLGRHERELAPLARDLAERVLIGMELGERSASEFLLALRQEIELEGRMIELRADLLERLMQLQRLTGGELGADEAWAYPQVYGGRQ